MKIILAFRAGILYSVNMINITTIQPGQRVTVKYLSPIEWARTTDNPLVDVDVERSMEVGFTAAGAETYGNMAERLGHETSGKPTWHRPAPEVGPCVRAHKSKGTLYLAGINHDTRVAFFTIGGERATPDQETLIRKFMPAPRERERGLDFRVWTLDKLQNAVIC